MFKSTKSQALKDNAQSAADFANSLAKDKKFRKELLSAVRHGTKAQKRASRRFAFMANAGRLATDPKLKNELKKMTTSLDKAWSRVEKKRSHKARNAFLLLLGAVGAGLLAARKVLSGDQKEYGTPTPRTIDETVEVNVPVSTAYNQWTQFEDFPLFMEGVDHVQQRDDTRLHWVATVAGKTHEWDAKILEQKPDQQISWISEDGKKTRGTVTFEPRGDNKTFIRLSMSYQAEGPLELIGSAAGLDARRVRGDLERFKELIESRGSESGAWRGKVSAGEKKS